jgi:hypothetical protein
MRRNRWMKGRARPRHVPGTMNKTEEAYAAHLTEQVALGNIAAWMFEPIRLRLASNTHYTPDFLVQCNDATMELHEVKACRASGAFLCEDDARVKIKVAAELYQMFGFIMAGKLPRKSGGGWRFETIGGEK